MGKYRSKSRVERDQDRLIDTPIAMSTAVGSVIEVLSQNAKSVGNIIVAIKNDDGTYSNEVASPMSPHFISLPLPNERVSLIKDGSSSKWYYLTPLSSNGLVNHMGNSLKRVFKKDTAELYTGKSFTPSPSIRSLNIYEGDTILQGRSGQSLRFGTNRRDTDAPWNTNSDEGLPIITLRTGVTQIENLNTDFSSIYLTSGQVLPIILKNKINPLFIKPDIFSDNQIVITSDRVTLISKEESVIIASAKQVGITTDKWAIDLSSVLDVISDLCEQVGSLADKINRQGLFSATSTHVSAAPGSPTTTSINAPQFQQISTEANTVKSQVQQIKNKLDNMKQ